MGRTLDRARPVWPVAPLVGLGLFGAPRSLAAQEIQKEPIRIAYDASPGCPDADAFTASVEARSSRLRIAEPGEVARTFAVTLVDGTPATGELNIVEGGHVDSARSVHAETCADAADAMALIVSLAVNPNRKPRAVTVPAPVEASAPSAPPPRRALPAPKPHRVRHRSHHRAARPAPVAVARSAPEPDEEPSPGTAYAGADFTVTGGVTPDALVAGSPYFGWRARDDGPLTAEFRVSVVRSLSIVGAGPGASVSFEWTAGRLDGCPLVWRPAIGRLTVCARIEAGAVRVDQSGVPDPREPVTGWFAVGPVVRAQRMLVDALFVDAEVGALVRATDTRFVVLPASTVYVVPLVGLSAALGVGALFP